MPTQLLFTFASGALVALAARAYLLGSRRTALLSQPFLAYLLYLVLVVLPASLYFYVYYRDWYLLYLVDSARVSTAFVVLGCLVEIALGAGGFSLGALFVRRQWDPWAGALIGVAISLALVVIPLARSRLAVVGTYAQYRGDYGLAPFGGALLGGTICMSLWMLVGLALLAYRVGAGAPRP